MKKLLFLLALVSLISCQNKGTDNKLEIVTQIDTTKYEEVRYVNAKHFTSSGLYNLHCKLCHGNNGTGDGVVARYNEEICPYDLSKVTKTDKEVYFVILNGADHMPDASKPVANHILTHDDIWLVVYYIKKFKE